MARSHARVHVSIWRDQDYLDLSTPAKFLYLALLSQPRLTIVGTIDLAERRWANVTGYTEDQTFAALAELEAGRYVIVDGETDELLIRSLPRHDIDPNRVNRNLGKGFWGAWGMVHSAVLRSAIVHELDDSRWEKLSEFAPEDAKQTRRSARLEPGQHFDGYLGRDRDDQEPDAPVATPPTSHHPPVTCRQPAEQRQQRIDEACTALATERAAARDDIGPGWIPAAARGIATDHHQELHAHLVANPAATRDDLIDVIEGASSPKPSRKPEPFNPASVLPTVEELMQDRPEANPEANLAGISEARLALHPTREEVRA